jgi:hypothetical protein
MVGEMATISHNAIHTNQICISIKVQASHTEDVESDQYAMEYLNSTEKRDQSFHFSFDLDQPESWRIANAQAELIDMHDRHVKPF